MKTIKVVAAVICDNMKEKNKIFATARGYGELKGGWEFPGGKIEAGETPQEALKREIMEELDTEIKVGDLIDTIEYDYPTFHLSMDCFWAEVTAGHLELKEAEAAKWLTKDLVSKVSGFVGNLLNICPLLNVDYQGKLIPREKIRTKKKVIAETVNKMVQNADNGLDYADKCYISMSACRQDAEAVAKLIEEKFPKLNGKVLINNIGTTIGSHTGPGTVALFFWGRKRID